MKDNRAIFICSSEIEFTVKNFIALLPIQYSQGPQKWVNELSLSFLNICTDRHTFLRSTYLQLMKLLLNKRTIFEQSLGYSSDGCWTVWTTCCEWHLAVTSSQDIEVQLSFNLKKVFLSLLYYYFSRVSHKHGCKMNHLHCIKLLVSQTFFFGFMSVTMPKNNKK